MNHIRCHALPGFSWFGLLLHTITRIDIQIINLLHVLTFRHIIHRISLNGFLYALLEFAIYKKQSFIVYLEPFAQSISKNENSVSFVLVLFFVFFFVWYKILYLLSILFGAQKSSSMEKNISRINSRCGTKPNWKQNMMNVLSDIISLNAI